jgi:hypothetical protein
MTVHNISPEQCQIWVARTADEVGLVTLDPAAADELAPTDADIFSVRRGDADICLAQLIGPIDGETPDSDRWELVARYRISLAGEPLSSIIAGLTPFQTGMGHDWGALGLPDGLDTRVVPADAISLADDALGVARASSGHQFVEASWQLTIGAGDRIEVDGRQVTVLTVDRRKRTAEIVDDTGAVRTIAFDEIDNEEREA